MQSNDTYIYGVGILAILAIGVCVFFTYNKKAGQVIHEQPIKNDVICFRKIYNKMSSFDWKKKKFPHVSPFKPILLLAVYKDLNILKAAAIRNIHQGRHLYYNFGPKRG